MTSLAGLKAVVTGGAAGIGWATVARLTEQGAQVAVIDRSPCPEAGTLGFLADMTDAQALSTAMADAAQALGGIDILVNSAGIDLEAPSESVADGDWSRVIEVNLTGPMRAARAAFPWLAKSDKAAIVNIASAAGLRPIPDRAAYTSSKAGLIMLSKSLALDWADEGIRVNVVCPGAVQTALFATSYEGAANPEARLAEIRARYPLKRVAEPEELAEAIVFLASPAASYITGVALAVDGGRSFH
ncbi:SDR family NAD(P)-dependent oxidoreductase [Seohaeicola zhoushanensis]|uniref:3-oxoacyl-ACP reductase n=1 Tax=Seohaeicola zhoushanensis TaxID=1569283 RepID=A0A8J3GV22_9RHOB|nr:SDR family oxidoreductase [Seohaeicola zhoushanensis]GHF39349.1 3-oxoacyl-ACP reductase [Seohaeicola zhoushanensis]